MSYEFLKLSKVVFNIQFLNPALRIQNSELARSALETEKKFFKDHKRTISTA